MNKPKHKIDEYKNNYKKWIDYIEKINDKDIQSGCAHILWWKFLCDIELPNYKKELWNKLRSNETDTSSIIDKVNKHLIKMGAISKNKK
jgi:hypothetical protein